MHRWKSLSTHSPLHPSTHSQSPGYPLAPGDHIASAVPVEEQGRDPNRNHRFRFNRLVPIPALSF